MTEWELHEKYDRLDGASLRAFIEEFLYRNEDFLRDITLIRESGVMTLHDRTRLFKKYKVFVGSPPYARTIRRYRGHVREGHLPVYLTPVASFWIFPREGSDAQVARIEEAARSALKYPWSNYSMGLNKSKKTSAFGSDVDRLLYYFFEAPNSDGEYTTGETLLLKIDPNAPKEEVKEVVDDILDIYGSPERGNLRRHTNKWKYYLMVHDLKQYYNDDYIAEMINQAYPSHKPRLDKEVCRRYYNSAKLLIEGEYKKYVSVAFRK